MCIMLKCLSLLLTFLLFLPVMIRSLFYILLCFSLCCTAQTPIDDLITEIKTSQESHKLILLDSLTKEMIRKGDSRQRKYLKDYMNLAFAKAEYDKGAQKARFLIYDYSYHNQLDSATILVDSLIAQKSRYDEPNKTLSHLLLKRGGLHFHKNNFEAAIQDYKASINGFLKSGDSIFAADAYQFTGQAHLELRQMPEALVNLEKATSLFERLGDYEYATFTKIDLIILYRANGLNDLAQQLVNESLETDHTAKAPCAAVLLTLHGLQMRMKNLDQADFENYLSKAGSYLKNCKVKTTAERFRFFEQMMRLKQAVTQENLGGARKAYNILSQEIQTTDDFYYDAVSLPVRAQYWRLLDKPEKAVEIIERFLDREGVKGASNYYQNALEELATSYTQLNDPAAVKIYAEYTRLKDSLYTASVANSLAYHQAKMDVESERKKAGESQKALEEAQDENFQIKESLSSTIIISGIVILCIAAFLAWLICWYRKKSRVLKEDLEQKDHKLEQTRNVVQNKTAKEERLKKEIEALRVLTEDRNEEEAIKALLDTRILTHDDWQDFKLKFRQIFPRFFTDVQKLDVKLTNSEERLLVLERLGLDNSEIAEMLGISPDSVTKTRYRLRKKLDLPKGESIINFLKNL